MHNPHLKPHLPSQPVNLKSAWGKLLAFARPWLPIGITGMVLAMVASIFALMGPDKLRDMTNLIQEGLMGEIDMDAIFRTGITLVILYGLAAIGHYIQHYLMATFTQRVSQALRQSISRKINQVPLGYYNQVSFGDVLSRVTNDVDTIGQTMNQSLGNQQHHGRHRHRLHHLGLRPHDADHPEIPEVLRGTAAVFGPAQWAYRRNLHRT